MQTIRRHIIKCEGVLIELDPRGSATAKSVNILTDELQRQSIKDPKTFTDHFETAWDAQADCDRILASMARFPRRPDTDGHGVPASAGREGLRRHHVPTTGDGTAEEPVDKTPTTIAELMGWGSGHVPAEQTASPIVPANPKPETETQAENPEPAVAPEPVTPVNTDVVVELGADDEADMAKGQRRLEPREQARMELDAYVDQAIESLDVCAPRAMTLEMLVTMARNEWMRRRMEKDPGADRSTIRLPQGNFAQKNIVVNFVKHELVFPRYDDVVREINSYGTLIESEEVERCYAKWRLAVIDRLGEAFPALATTANAQRLRRYDARLGRLVPIPGAVLPERDDGWGSGSAEYGVA